MLQCVQENLCIAACACLCNLPLKERILVELGLPVTWFNKSFYHGWERGIVVVQPLQGVLTDRQLKFVLYCSRLLGVRYLDMSGHHIVSLPPLIGQLSYIEQLFLGWNDLCMLPPEIGQLRSLERLSLHSNKLSGLPCTIGNLQGLRDLDLSDNRLVILPDEIGNMPNLGVMLLAQNSLDVAMLPLITRLRQSGVTVCQ